MICFFSVYVCACIHTHVATVHLHRSKSSFVDLVLLSCHLYLGSRDRTQVSLYSSHLHPVSPLTGFVLWRWGFTYPKAGLKLPILLSLLPKYYRICHHTWLREYFSEIQSQHGAQAGFELPTILLSSPSKCWDFFFPQEKQGAGGMA